MSHSWHDDPKVKWSVLKEFAEDFKTKNGRNPTFWLDKVGTHSLAFTHSLPP